MTGNKEEIALLPCHLVLEGEAARLFEEYNKRPLTEEEEQQILVESDRVYKSMCDKNKKMEQAEKIKQAEKLE